ncbi:LysM peptidoglycan-binding domain-containing protein [Paenibacillus glycanilyticus]|uniref:cell division suppressor protein YneA n=1 Tax=Paenibacillus glycanilyticus TaxID=126569 RepID=UPI00203DE511|nr:LysM peptidoglycan-binding domain-containing protein [Paenibacillus glycanilyticus]MCM3629981.1 LysM peptidoglycan-binding domain-containing protein [Paenibacillus glycanilyticus]
MIMNPSFYKSIHKDEAVKSIKSRGHNINRHAFKLIVSAAVFVLLFTSFLMMRTNASSDHIEAASMNEQTVIVSAGDTLWGIADRFADNSKDIREYIYTIKERNQLSSVELKPGQVLIIP